MSLSPSLAELQRWMRWALTHPLGVAQATGGGTLTGLPGRFDPPATAALPAVAGDSIGGRTALDRLSVYGSGYFHRLHGTLQLEFPRLATALSEDAFRALVASHLLRAPSTQPSLADLGEGLAETLRTHPSVVEAPWLVDLARVERAVAEVWLSSGAARTQWTHAPEANWEQVQLELDPGARHLRLAWDVGEWTPGQGPPPRRDGWLMVYRVDSNTMLESLEPRSGALLEALAGGIPLGPACALADSLGMSADEVARAFGHWTARGWLIPGAG